MDLKLSGSRVLITGGSRGIGGACARSYAEEGVATLHLIARNKERLEEFGAEVRHRWGTEVFTYTGDLGDPAFRSDVLEQAGDLDILVNNAGDDVHGSIETVDYDFWQASLEAKFWAYIDLTRRTYQRMQAAGTGVIVNNIGLAAERPDYDYIAGAVVSSGLMSFTRTIGAWSMDYGVRVLCVNPGLTSTERVEESMRHRAMTRSQGADWEALLKSDLSGRPGSRAATVEEVADAIVFLSSSRSGYTSGCALTVDGGMAWRRPRVQ